jgi:O-antigen/teichoic acid export membrane protein
LIVYVLVRIVPNNIYPWIVFFSAVGNYVLAVDFGYSGFIYASTRQKFIEGKLAGQSNLISEALNVYMLIPLAAAPVVAGLIFATIDATPVLKASVSIYFLSIVLSMPWALMRRAGAAVDQFVVFEVLELARRVIFCGLTSAMLAGLPFLTFGILCLCVWVVAFVLAGLILTRRGVHIKLANPSELAAHLRHNHRHIMTSGWFTVLEFLIYNFPYMLLPFLYADGTRIVAFDVFYKVVRFGGVAYGVAFETFLPYQTRAYYSGNLAQVRKYLANVELLAVIPFVIATAALIVAGGPFFHFLLNNAALISHLTRWTMILMLLFILLQSSPGSFLVGIGRYRDVSRRAAITTTLMVLLSVAAWIFKLPFDQFLLGYVLLYGLHAAMFQWLFYRTTKPEHTT